MKLEYRDYWLTGDETERSIESENWINSVPIRYQAAIMWIFYIITAWSVIKTVFDLLVWVFDIELGEKKKPKKD